jgi:acetyl-CoA acetyltransferase
MSRVQDQVAIVGVGTSPYARDRGKSELAMVVEASRNAIRDAGLTAKDIDGLSGSWVRAELVQSALGIPACTWYANTVPPPFHLQVIAAMNAVFAGMCETVLVCHSAYRMSGSAAARDPFRAARASVLKAVLPQPSPWPDSIAPTLCYATWASRYLHDYGGKREHLGYIAINGRSNAALNEHAVLRDPISMEDYLAAPVIHEPLNLLDMDYAIDGADALVITTAERAKDGPNTPVIIHAAVLGQTDHAVEEDLPDLESTGQKVVHDNLWSRSELSLDDVDVFFPYDGFTIIALKWIESVGYCGPGEAGAFLEENWNTEANRIEIGGRVLVNTHGGSLSEGASQGAGHMREAVLQLRGQAGARQAANVATALVAGGGFFFNAGALLLRT